MITVILNRPINPKRLKHTCKFTCPRGRRNRSTSARAFGVGIARIISRPLFLIPRPEEKRYFCFHFIRLQPQSKSTATSLELQEYSPDPVFLVLGLQESSPDPFYTSSAKGFWCQIARIIS